MMFYNIEGLAILIYSVIIAVSFDLIGLIMLIDLSLLERRGSSLLPARVFSLLFRLHDLFDKFEFSELWLGLRPDRARFLTECNFHGAFAMKCGLHVLAPHLVVG